MVKDFYSQFLGTPKKTKAKTPKIKFERVYTMRAGDRTLTPEQKRKVKEDQGFRCARCGKKTDARYLEVHHKKGVAKHKNPFGDLPVYSWGKKIKPKSDRRSNLEAVCLKCHDKTKKKKKKKVNNLLRIDTRGLLR